MTLLYVLIGMVLGAAALFLVLRFEKTEVPGGNRALVDVLWLIALLLIAFGLSWAVAALEEGVAQSAAMGILVFSGIGLIFGIVGYRLSLPSQPAATETE